MRKAQIGDRERTINNRFVEIGRACVVNNGENYGKLCIIVDVVDQNRVIVDGPTSGLSRRMINIKSIHLLDIVTKIPRGIRQSKLKVYMDKDKVDEKWKSTPFFKKIESRHLRSKMNDFDRFKEGHKRRIAAHVRRNEEAVLKKKEKSE